MKNHIENNQNNGIQEFKETNNYYVNIDNKTPITDIVDDCKPIFKFSFSVFLNIIALIADIASIHSFFNELPKHGSIVASLFDYMLNSEINYILLISIAILTTFFILLLSMNAKLLLKNKEGRFLRIKNSIYVIKLKKCPKCSNHCSGKLKFEFKNNVMYVKCTKDESHKWRLDYSLIFDLIDKIFENPK